MTVVLCPPSRLQELTVKEGGGQDAAVTAAEERSLAVPVGEVKPVGPQEKGKEAHFQLLGKKCVSSIIRKRDPRLAHSYVTMCPVPSPVHREPICCECQAKFGGYLPVPRAKAALPYWVPLSLRPQNQIQKMVQSYIPKTAKACPCPCHRFGGHLPMPRDQAVMPYWVPQVLRSHKKVVKRQQNFKGVPEAPLDVRSGYNCWRICGEGRHLLKWQQLQALHQAGPVASGQPESPPASLLPLNLSLLTLLHALLRVMEAIRSFYISAELVFFLEPRRGEGAEGAECLASGCSLDRQEILWIWILKRL
ncbi:hypothetical protein MG293_014984 [Ovis ammon polii]|uniref:Uncharacterized protein n=1 Tax=Ovis ammon polii TaxID=230172 RepID=A0AAD4TXL0_OVIAM|nr:hypothetical protein MG293_014984 [Ovis ammon polii]